MEGRGCDLSFGGLTMEAGFTAAPAMGQNPGAQDLIGTVSAISNSLMNEVSKVIIGKNENLRRVLLGFYPTVTCFSKISLDC